MKKIITNNDTAIVDYLSEVDPKHKLIKRVENAPWSIKEIGGTFFMTCKSFPERNVIILLCYYQKPDEYGNHMRLFIGQNLWQVIRILTGYFYRNDLNLDERYSIINMIDTLKQHANNHKIKQS